MGIQDSQFCGDQGLVGETTVFARLRVRWCRLSGVLQRGDNIDLIAMRQGHTQQGLRSPHVRHLRRLNRFFYSVAARAVLCDSVSIVVTHMYSSVQCKPLNACTFCSFCFFKVLSTYLLSSVGYTCVAHWEAARGASDEKK